MGKYINITGRSTWGARYGEGWDFRPMPATEAWLHHSETKNLSVNASLAEEYEQVRLLDQIGYQRFGPHTGTTWRPPMGAGISYTWAVAPSGRVYEGHNVKRQSSHTLGHNTAGVGIVLMGNYMTTAPTSAQIEAVARLLCEAKSLGYIKYARLNGGHRDAVQTDCPGDAAYPYVSKINNRAYQILQGGTSTPPSTTTSSGFWFDDAEYVKGIQTGLHMLDFYESTIDGSAGPATIAAVKAFQFKYGLTVDGAAGAATKTKLISVVTARLNKMKSLLS